MNKTTRARRIALLSSCLLYPLAAAALPPASPREKAADKLISDFSATTRFSELINPSPESARREKTAFFSRLKRGETYEPVFEYEPLPAAAGKAAKKLKGYYIGVSSYSAFLGESREMLLVKYELLAARGRPEFSGLSAGLYKPPSPEEVQAALLLLKDLGAAPPPSVNAFSAGEMAAELKKELETRGLKKWKVRISDKMSASASVLPGARVVQLKKGARYAKSDIVRLVQHEIGVHAQRAENGHGMPLRIFRVGLEGYLATEEGMAAWNEASHGINDGLRLFALRVLAVDWACSQPFSKVFSGLTGLGVPEELAWTITLRVKRGMTETGVPGCYTKDVSYFRGYRKVRTYLEKGGSWKELMRYGKISIDNLPALRALE